MQIKLNKNNLNFLKQENQKMNYTKLQKKIIEYISKIYQKEQNLKIEITKIDFIKFKNESNKFLIYFEYDFIDDNNNDNFS